MSVHGKNMYWEIYLIVLDFWTGQIFPKILYIYIYIYINSILIQAQSKNEIISNFIVKFLKKL